MRLALLAALVATVALFALAASGRFNDYRSAQAAAQVVAEAQRGQLRVHDLQRARGLLVLGAAQAGKAAPTADFEQYTDLIALISQEISGLDRIGDPALRDAVRALDKVGDVKETMAQRRGLLSGVFASGDFAPPQYARFVAIRSGGQDHLHDFDRLATDDQRARVHQVLGSRAAEEAAGYEAAAVQRFDSHRPEQVDPIAWWKVTTAVIDDLRSAQQELADDIARHAERQQRVAAGDLALCLVLGLAAATAEIRLFTWRRADRDPPDTQELGALLGAASTEDAWQLAAQRVAELPVGSCVLLLRKESTARETVSFAVCAGDGAEEMLRLRPAIESSCVPTTGEPVVLDDLGDHIRQPSSTFGPAVAVPMPAVSGVLLAARGHGRFTGEEVAELVSLADRIGAALRLAESQQARRWSDLQDDRDRIARGLYDRLIHRLLAMGISLQGIVSAIPHPMARNRVSTVVTQLDDTIQQVRNTIFDLQETPPRASLRQRLVDIAVGLLEGQDITLTVSMATTVDRLLPEQLSDHVEAVVHEAVRNVVRHGRATELSLTLEITAALTITVQDNGDGPSGGAADLERLAAELGGALTVTRVPDGGTRLVWRVPLGQAPA